MVSTENPTDSRAWVCELEAAGVLRANGRIDSNGNVVIAVSMAPPAPPATCEMIPSTLRLPDCAATDDEVR